MLPLFARFCAQFLRLTEGQLPKKSAPLSLPGRREPANVVKKP
jgi:hypothetical protein